ncbi:MAG: hypothetical protein C4297_09820 [Gemmataceae bacterium]
MRMAASTMIVLLMCACGGAEEIEGVLLHRIMHGQLVLDVGGQHRTFQVTPQTKYYEGIRGDVPTNDTLLHPGVLVRVTYDDRGQALEVVALWRWHELPGLYVQELVAAASQRWAELFGPDAFFAHPWRVMAFLSVVTVSVMCGMVSSLVVSNRMAFFSDALAHCAFAGVGLGLILYLTGLLASDDGILALMILFGVVVGLAIAYVKDQTHLASDTVIGVFFAGAMGLGAMLLTGISRLGGVTRTFSPENFLFGDPWATTGKDLFYFVLLLGGMLVFLAASYNGLVFSSFSTSLARSRRIPTRLYNYLFITLLAFTVNMCLKMVGVLLINNLLVVPAATAANLARNLRQFFWLSVLFAVLASVAGLLFSHAWVLEYEGQPVPLGSGGMIVVCSVVLFALSMVCGPVLRVAGRAGPWIHSVWKSVRYAMTGDRLERPTAARRGDT